MQAVVMHETGDPAVLRYEEADRPEPSDGEVLIRVHAVSVNPVDWKYRRGFVETSLPAVLGIDVSGTVEASRADDFAEGDRGIRHLGERRVRGVLGRVSYGDREEVGRPERRAGGGDPRRRA